MSKNQLQFTEQELDQLEAAGFTVIVLGKKVEVVALFREINRLKGRLRSVAASKSRLRRQISGGDA